MHYQVRSHQSGNILLALFAGIALIGLLGVAITNFMQGPLRSSVNVSRNTVAETQMLAASKLVAASASTSPTGDCDSDGLKEPPEWKVATGAAGTFPAGGGHVPDTLGAAKTDPWGTPYGYCGWDHGTKINDAACGGSVQKRLGGGTATSGIAISMISAGPDKVFQTTCAADPNYVTKPSGSDDVVMNYTVAEMNALGAGTGGGGTTTTPADCTGLGAAFYNDAGTGHCYYRSSATANWANAQTACQGNGGYLAVISSSNENDTIKNGLVLSSSPFYIGAKDDLVHDEWRWKGGELDGVQFWQGDSAGSAVGGRYSNWQTVYTGYPVPNGGYDCVTLGASSGPSNGHTWQNTSCSGLKSYICEKSPTTTVASGGGDNLGDHTATKDLAMNGYKITGAGVPILLTDVANKAYVDSIAASGGGGGSAAPFSFQTKTNIIYDTKQRSNIVQVTGITGEATAVVSGDGKPSYRICSNADCSTVTSDWTTASQKITNNAYVQLQTFATYTNSLQITVGLTIGSTTGNWRIMANPSVAAFTLGSSTNVAPGSSIVKISSMIVPQGIKSLTFSVSGSGNPRYSILGGSVSGSTCSYGGWIVGSGGDASAVTTDTTISVGHGCYTAYVWTNAPNISNTTQKVTFSANEASADWEITTLKAGYFVMTNATFNGNLGGLSGADAKCLADLNANDWKGKADSTAGNLLTSSNVKAFLCDQTTCNNLQAGKNYYFARAPYPTIGGDKVDMNAAGEGSYQYPWAVSTKFMAGAGSPFWTNRNGSGSFWYSTPIYGSSYPTYNCNNFTSTISSYYSVVGTAQDSYDYVSQQMQATTYGCNNSGVRLVCIVHPAP